MPRKFLFRRIQDGYRLPRVACTSCTMIGTSALGSTRIEKTNLLSARACLLGSAQKSCPAADCARHAPTLGPEGSLSSCRHAAHPGLNGQNSLSILEAEQQHEIILRTLAIRAQCGVSQSSPRHNCRGRISHPTCGKGTHRVACVPRSRKRNQRDGPFSRRNCGGPRL